MKQPLTTLEQIADSVRPPPTFSQTRHADRAVRKVLVTTDVPEQQTAWTKARKDVLHLTRGMGYQTLALPVSLLSREWQCFFAQLGAQVGRGDRVLVEYPFGQRRRLYPLFAYCRLKGIRLHGLIHDLDALRHHTPRTREIAILKLFDGLISHNPVMSNWLREGGISRPVVDLDLFDYVTQSQPAREAAAAWHEQALASPLKVVCAGNLSWNKAGYIYDPRLGELQGTSISLFGAFFEPERMPPSPVVYKGVFEADRPALDGRYHFGLVWDGESVERCEGKYGHYMRYNNPHKVSLYAALGLPVVVWNESAVARFVLEQDVGVTVSDLRELGDIPARVPNADYVRMTRNMRRLSQDVRRGRFLQRALEGLAAT